MVSGLWSRCTKLTPVPAGHLCVDGSSSDSLQDIVLKMHPSLAESVRAIFKFSFAQVHGHREHEVLYVLVDPHGCKVNSSLLNIFITLDRKAGCWNVSNSIHKIMCSVGPLQSHLHNQTSFSLAPDLIPVHLRGCLRPFDLSFKSCSPPPAWTFQQRLVPKRIEVSLLRGSVKYGGAFQLGDVSDTFEQQYDRTTDNKGEAQDCCLGIDCNGEAQPFRVTLWGPDGTMPTHGMPKHSHFAVARVRWVLCDPDGTVYARSLDFTESPFLVLWWELFEKRELVYSGMDLCISVPGVPVPHDVHIVESTNDSLNCLFTSSPAAPDLDGSHYSDLVYQHIASEPQMSPSSLNLVFIVAFQTWAVMALDPYSTPHHWNRLAMSDSSGTYTDPTLCKEWYVLDSKGAYKLSPDMHCVTKPRASRMIPRRAIVKPS